PAPYPVSLVLALSPMVANQPSPAGVAADPKRHPFQTASHSFGGCRICDLRVPASPRSAEPPELEDRRMHVIHRRGWEIPEHHATPEHLFLDRRAFLAAAGMAAISLSPTLALAQRAADVPDPTADLYPVKRNEKYVLDRPITDEALN